LFEILNSQANAKRHHQKTQKRVPGGGKFPHGKAIRFLYRASILDVLRAESSRQRFGLHGAAPDPANDAATKGFHNRALPETGQHGPARASASHRVSLKTECTSPFVEK
jgi:hypothetical protein